MYVVTVRTGDKCGEDYEIALRRQVAEHLDKTLVVVREQQYPFEGWWSKIELFSPEFLFRPCLFFDLDTYILDDCRDLLFEPDDLWLIRDLGQPDRSNSGVMIIPENTSQIWEASKDWTTNADGDFLTTQPHKVLQDHFDGIVSYKRHAKREPCGRVVCFHGKPKPHEAQGWAGERWAELTS